jgi:hypothetical protein
MLQAKTANLATLDQTDRNDRNDLKHVHIMLMVTREYLIMMIQAVEVGGVGSRAVIDRLEQVLEIVVLPRSGSVQQEISHRRERQKRARPPQRDSDARREYPRHRRA